MNEPPPADAPRLLADIGGTYARFAVETGDGRFEHVASLRCADHADFHDAVRAYLSTLPTGHIPHAAIAIANPVDGDEVRMTNYHWHFSIEQMRQRLGLDTLVVVNDFTALAMALPRLALHERRAVGGGAPRDRSVIGLLGAGVAALLVFSLLSDTAGLGVSLAARLLFALIMIFAVTPWLRPPPPALDPRDLPRSLTP